jgi:hypothetical protein
MKYIVCFLLFGLGGSPSSHQDQHKGLNLRMKLGDYISPINQCHHHQNKDKGKMPLQHVVFL